MSFLPTTRGGLLWRALLGMVLVFGFTAGATAVAGLLQVNQLVKAFKPTVEHFRYVTPPKLGKPETLLLIGSDHRAGSGSYLGSNTDTMLLVRINDSSQTINLLSIPRDLKVMDADGEPTKLNAFYASGGPSALLEVLKTQVFPNLQVNHIIDTNFTGFSDLINAIGCVYTDVDHRYYNVSAPTVANNFSSIDIEPGYQRLCGGVHSVSGTGALAFVRFRHTDSDVVRNARQQDFIRWAKDGYSTDELIKHRTKLVDIFAKHTTADSSLATEDGFIDLFDLVVGANKLSLKTIQFPEYFGTCTAQATGCVSYVLSCPELSTCSQGYGGPDAPLGEPTEATEAIWNAFITPTKAAITPALPRSRDAVPTHVTRPKVHLAGLTADPADGRSQSSSLGDVGLAIYYPRYIIDTAGAGYCSARTENCNDGAEPSSAYDGSYPRRYEIVGPGHTRYRSYVMTLVINAGLGEYYTVQGTTWQHPPILNDVSRVIRLHGKTLDEYEDGAKISLVAFHAAHAVYWVSNTLANAISNSEMVAMAAEMTRYPSLP